MGGRFPDLKLSGSQNTLTGDYVILYGAMRLGDGENIPDSVTVRLQKDAELFVDGSESLSGLAGTGRVRLTTPGRSTLMLGRCEGSANRLVVGQKGKYVRAISRRERAGSELWLSGILMTQRITAASNLRMAPSLLIWLKEAMTP